MKPWIAECIRLGKAKGFLTYTEVNQHGVDDQEITPDDVYELLLLLEESNVELIAEDEVPVRQLDASPRLPPIYHKFATDLMEGWKSYPVRILGPQMSECHRKPTLLVQSMRGGFVTANCSECGQKSWLRESDFRQLPAVQEPNESRKAFTNQESGWRELRIRLLQVPSLRLTGGSASSVEGDHVGARSIVRPENEEKCYQFTFSGNQLASGMNEHTFLAS